MGRGIRVWTAQVAETQGQWSHAAWAGVGSAVGVVGVLVAGCVRGSRPCVFAGSPATPSGTYGGAVEEGEWGTPSGITHLSAGGRGHATVGWGLGGGCVGASWRKAAAQVVGSFGAGVKRLFSKEHWRGACPRPPAREFPRWGGVGHPSTLMYLLGLRQITEATHTLH